jgi:hypothetical protein
MNSDRVFAVSSLLVVLGCGETPSGAPRGAGTPADAGRASSDTSSLADADATAAGNADAEPSDATMPISWDGRVPPEHRASGVACSDEREAGLGGVGECLDGDAPPLPGNPCAANSDCNAGLDGVCFCLPALIAPPSGSGQGSLYTETSCSYDECLTDSDCGTHIPCDCRYPTIAGSPNVCLTASNCAVDSDCGPPGFCSPSNLPGQSPEVGYFCRTPNDTCVDDADCPVGPEAMGAECRFDMASAIWTCFQIIIAHIQ